MPDFGKSGSRCLLERTVPSVLQLRRNGSLFYGKNQIGESEFAGPGLNKLLAFLQIK